MLSGPTFYLAVRQVSARQLTHCWSVDLLPVPTELSYLFNREHAVCARTRKSKLQIARGLGEFVLQICFLGLSARPSLSASARLIRRATSALEHTNVFAWWYITRANLLREMARQIVAPSLEATKLHARAGTE
jgi:hypothetical protein